MHDLSMFVLIVTVFEELFWIYNFIGVRVDDGQMAWSQLWSALTLRFCCSSSQSALGLFKVRLVL